MTVKKIYVRRLSPKEVRAERLVPFEIKNRYGYSGDTNEADLPSHVQWEIEASEKWLAESSQNGTMQEDYPQLYKLPGPFDDLRWIDGLIVHEYQL
jgi:hypothetical protein